MSESRAGASGHNSAGSAVRVRAHAGCTCGLVWVLEAEDVGLGGDAGLRSVLRLRFLATAFRIGYYSRMEGREVLSFTYFRWSGWCLLLSREKHGGPGDEVGEPWEWVGTSFWKGAVSARVGGAGESRTLKLDLGEGR